MLQVVDRISLENNEYVIHLNSSAVKFRLFGAIIVDFPYIILFNWHATEIKSGHEI